MSERAAVITCSDAKSADPARDESGPLAAGRLADEGFTVSQVSVVPDEVPRIAAAIRQAIDTGHRLVVCTGGSGIGPRDVTPEAVAALGGRDLPGVGEAMRAAARQQIPTTDLSRCGAAAVGDVLVLVLPGSPSGVRDGLAVAGPLLGHALQILAGGGHHHEHADPPAARPAAVVGPDPIDAAAVVQQVRDRAAGAVVTFEGRVRDHDHDRAVMRLGYEAHPGAADVLADIVAAAQARPGVLGAAAAHRTGELAIGDLAFCVAVAAAHRREAFEACAWLVDEAKAHTPIWKHQTFADGTTEWVNCP